MCQLNLINLDHQTIKLHDSILDLLFKHKNEISRKLSDIRGIYNIDHVAINIINPSNEVAIFSITPSVEYNLVIQNLWRFDGSLCPLNYTDGSFFFWDQAYINKYAKEIKLSKEIKHGFSLGFSLAKKVGQHHLVYSFATRSQEHHLKEYYKLMINELWLLGDYGYNLIRDIYDQYSNTHTSPYIGSGKQAEKHKSHLKLIINNT